MLLRSMTVGRRRGRMPGTPDGRPFPGPGADGSASGQTPSPIGDLSSPSAVAEVGGVVDGVTSGHEPAVDPLEPGGVASLGGAPEPRLEPGLEPGFEPGVEAGLEARAEAGAAPAAAPVGLEA